MSCLADGQWVFSCSDIFDLLEGKQKKSRHDNTYLCMVMEVSRQMDYLCGMVNTSFFGVCVHQ